MVEDETNMQNSLWGKCAFCLSEFLIVPYPVFVLAIFFAVGFFLGAYGGGDFFDFSMSMDTFFDPLRIDDEFIAGEFLKDFSL